ncbi:modification DNA methylase [mine drainage metagenome]|uniref:Modification DNA methylase n=1 Tax=mine drainage metagenome TaxID=410659 RepID=T1A164_9ZZZZ
MAHIVEVFREVRRVLRADGTCWVNLGDTYIGTGNGPASRVGKLKPKDLVGIPWRVAFALQEDGWWLRSDCIWYKRNPMPKPAHDRPTQTHEYVFLLAKSRRYFYDPEAVREPLEESSLRRLRNHLPNAADNPAYRSKHPEGDFRRFPMLANTNPSGRHLRSVWQIAVQPYREAHFATFPEKLAENCIKAGSPRGGIVLDPFAGSGTTLAVARSLGRRSVGIELNPDYVELARHRCRVPAAGNENSVCEVPA